MTGKRTALTSRPGRGSRLGFIAAAAAVIASVVGALLLGLGSAPRTPDARGDVVIITRGETVDLEQHLVPDKYTLVDFYADWCSNCRRLSPIVEDFARRLPRLAVRKVNIISWDSPVAKQFSITALPHLLLYDPRGQLVAEGDRTLDVLRRLLS
ncbi:MAG: thioredoxin family protein [Acidobacteriota bacterium]